jgi:hypothetical protein
MGKKRNTYGIVVEKPAGESSLGEPRHRWEDNTELVREEKVWKGADWLDLTQERDKLRAVVWTEMELRIA